MLDPETLQLWNKSPRPETYVAYVSGRGPREAHWRRVQYSAHKVSMATVMVPTARPTRAPQPAMSRTSRETNTPLSRTQARIRRGRPVSRTSRTTHTAAHTQKMRPARHAKLAQKVK